MKRDGMNTFLYQRRKTHIRHNKKITGVEIPGLSSVKNHLKFSTSNPKKIEGRKLDTRLGHWDFSLT